MEINIVNNLDDQIIDNADNNIVHEVSWISGGKMGNFIFQSQ